MANQAQGAPTVQLQTPATQPSGQAQIPFRAATMERVNILSAETGIVLGTALQPIERTVEGAGYVYGIMLDVVATGATSTAASVAVYSEDAPFNILDTVKYSDANGELWSLSGWESALVSVLTHEDANQPIIANATGAALPGAGTGGMGTTSSQDPNVVLNVGSVGTASTGSTAGGNFRFPLRVKVAANRRDLLGILGNQDRSQKFQLRTDVSALSVPFSTAPSSSPALTINKFYEYYSIPLPTAPDGTPQEVFPVSFGTLLFHTHQTSPNAPGNGAATSHFLQRLGNTVHWIALVFRSATSSSTVGTRGNADQNPPTSIQFKLGEDVEFTETWTYRRDLMFERLGFDAPRGVLLYDWIHDFGPMVGFELGDDLIHTDALVNAQHYIAYPATANTWQPGGTSLKYVMRDDIFNQPAVSQVRS
jgi:hypothetical protein